MKRNRCIIVTAILFAVLIMSVGYATFATKLTINGTAEIVGNWNIKIVGIEAIEVSEGADPGTPEYTDTTATFYAKLKKPEDKITYLITIENAGTLDAKLLDATFNCEEDEKQKILLAVVNPAEILPAGEQTTLKVMVFYDAAVDNNDGANVQTINGVINYVQK